MAALSLLEALFCAITTSSTTPAQLSTLHEHEHDEASGLATSPSRSRITSTPEEAAASCPPSSRTRRSASTYATQLSLPEALTSPRVTFNRMFFGPSKTRRSLSEEAETGDESALSSWFREGEDPDAFDAYGYTPLLNASALGRVEAIQALLSAGATVNKRGPFGFTPLHAAAQNGHREAVSALLAAGADVNAQNCDMDTPMHLALRAHYIEIVYLLVRSGGNTKLEGFQKKDCVNVAKECGLADLSISLKNFYAPSIGYHPHSNLVLSTSPSSRRAIV